jgi:hypothetical protein
MLALRCGAPPEERHVEVPLARRYGIGPLDGVAGQVADWFGIPLESRDVW